MRLAHSLLAATALIGLALTAHATPVTFNFSGTGTGSGDAVGSSITYTGTITIDTSTYTVTGEDIKATASGSANYYFTDPSIGKGGFFSPDRSYTADGETFSDVATGVGSSGAGFLYISFLDPVSGLYNGGSVFSKDSSLTSSLFSFTVKGTIAPADAPPTPAAAATPEPSSLILLGTGVLGLAGATRRRFLKA